MGEGNDRKPVTAASAERSSELVAAEWTSYLGFDEAAVTQSVRAVASTSLGAVRAQDRGEPWIGESIIPVLRRSLIGHEGKITLENLPAVE
jgi:hypothetical protein